MQWLPARESSGGEFKTLQHNTWTRVLLPALVVLSVAVTQLSGGAYQRELTSHSDEAAHFVSAMCVLDYFRTALGRDPVSFAESYYIHYPKVALGHWPPVFFAIQAIWYWIVGGTASAGILLIGLIAASTALVLFGRLRRFFGTWIAGVSLALYFSLPVVRSSSSVLMPDMLAGLFGLLAVLAFCDGCVAGPGRPWIASAVWGAMAVLTKESALLLMVFAPAALILLAGETRRTSRMTWRFWAAYCVFVLLLLGIYQFTGVMQLRGVPTVIDPARLWERVRFLLTFVQMVPWPVFVIAGLGALSGAAIRNGADRMVALHVRGAVLWLLVWLAAQAVFRDVIEQRYFLPAVFPLIILVAAGLDRLSRLVGSRVDGLPIPRWATLAAARIVPTTVIIACVALIPVAASVPRAGYAQVAAALPAAAAAPVILISSDVPGEGALIVECLVRDDARERIVLRASKMLATSDWMGGNYRLLTTSVAEVRDLLDAIPVQFIILDARGFIDEGTRSHHRLLEKTVTEASDHFRLVADFPLLLGNRRQEGAIQVYENLKARGRHPGVIRVSMLETLGRTLELRPDEERRLDTSTGAHSRRAMQIGDGIRRFANGLARLLPNQQHDSRRFRIEPTVDTVGAEGGPGVITVTANMGEEWAARTTAEWLTVKLEGSRAGNGVVHYHIAPNDLNGARSGEITIGEARYLVLQSAP